MVRISMHFCFSIFFLGSMTFLLIFIDQENPAPKFFSSGVQVLLKRLTRPDFSKVFRKRTNSNNSVLKTPIYKFLTDEELSLEIQKANKSAERLLQMPPIIKVITTYNFFSKCCCE